MSYSLDHDIVRLRQGSQVRAYGAGQVQYFEFLDHQFNVRRIFYALPYALLAGYQRPMFFELLVDGAYALLTRERRMERHQVVDQHWLVSWPVSKNEFMVHTYYLLYKQGDIRQINLRDIRSACTEPNAAETLSQYRKREKLKPEKQSDMIRLIMHLNHQITHT